MSQCFCCGFKSWRYGGDLLGELSVDGVEVGGDDPGQSGHRLAILEERDDESGRREPGDIDGRARNSRRCQVLIDQVHARGEAPFRRVRIERRRDRLEGGAGSAEGIAHHGGEMVVIGVGGGQINITKRATKPVLPPSSRPASKSKTAKSSV